MRGSRAWGKRGSREKECVEPSREGDAQTGKGKGSREGPAGKTARELEAAGAGGSLRPKSPEFPPERVEGADLGAGAESPRGVSAAGHLPFPRERGADLSPARPAPPCCFVGLIGLRKAEIPRRVLFPKLISAASLFLKKTGTPREVT